ncbi:hypothetical protein D9M71_811340 [compost metagenome]
MATNDIVMATVDELGKQVILIGRLEVDGLTPGSIAQPRPFGLGVPQKAFETVAHEPCHEAIPFSAVEGIGLGTEGVDPVTGLANGFTEVVPCATGQ